jgi:hypothetical protein
MLRVGLGKLAMLNAVKSSEAQIKIKDANVFGSSSRSKSVLSPKFQELLSNIRKDA